MFDKVLNTSVSTPRNSTEIDETFRRRREVSVVVIRLRVLRHEKQSYLTVRIFQKTGTTGIGLIQRRIYMKT